MVHEVIKTYIVTNSILNGSTPNEPYMVIETTEGFFRISGDSCQKLYFKKMGDEELKRFQKVMNPPEEKSTDLSDMLDEVIHGFKEMAPTFLKACNTFEKQAGETRKDILKKIKEYAERELEKGE